ncbi:hypothetical protein GQ53DRAFT_214838 [Thozetella sp. PMI_491]|nr:hypothetical protein GQ53DRAFT_214838 [Thozetella sp. PMI_491]
METAAGTFARLVSPSVHRSYLAELTSDKTKLYAPAVEYRMCITNASIIHFCESIVSYNEARYCVVSGESEVAFLLATGPSSVALCCAGCRLIVVDLRDDEAEIGRSRAAGLVYSSVFAPQSGARRRGPHACWEIRGNRKQALVVSAAASRAGRMLSWPIAAFGPETVIVIWLPSSPFAFAQG